MGRRWIEGWAVGLLEAPDKYKVLRAMDLFHCAYPVDSSYILDVRLCG